MFDFFQNWMKKPSQLWRKRHSEIRRFFGHILCNMIIPQVIILIHSRNPRRILLKARFLDEKALLRQILLVVGQKKCAFSIPDIIQAIK